MVKYKNTFIRNIYYMLAYAFRSLHQKQYQHIAVEEFDHIHNLLAAILARGIGVQLKRGLYREYVGRRENLLVLRGRIHISGTIRNKIARKRQIDCEFDELSENNLLNQILKTTAIILLKHKEVAVEYRNILKQEMLYFAHVEEIDLRYVQWLHISHGRNVQDYGLLLGVCRLVAENMLLTTEQGSRKLAAFDDINRISWLYEKFLLAYYKRKFPQLDVSASQIPWALDDGYDSMLPKMQTDLMLKKDNRVLIIDAKFYSHISQRQYDIERLRSAHLYQIFAYVKNMEYYMEEKPHQVSGMLLYARTEGEQQPCHTYQMHGNKISVRTLDMNLPFREITKQLNEIAREHFQDIGMPENATIVQEAAHSIAER